jgi:hypothetical protein
MPQVYLKYDDMTQVELQNSFCGNTPVLRTRIMQKNLLRSYHFLPGDVIPLGAAWPDIWDLALCRRCANH